MCVWGAERISVAARRHEKVLEDGVGRVGQTGKGLLCYAEFRFCFLGQWLSMLLPSATSTHKVTPTGCHG